MTDTNSPTVAVFIYNDCHVGRCNSASCLIGILSIITKMSLETLNVDLDKNAL